MDCLTTQKVAFHTSPLIGAVTFGRESGEALVFTRPFVFALVVKAQAHALSLLCRVGKGQTDSQWRVQLGDGVALAVQKCDVQDSAGQHLLVRRIAYGTANVGSDQSGVGFVAQVGRDKEGSHWILTWRAGELHKLARSEVGGKDNCSNQRRTDGGEGSGRGSDGW